MSFSSTLWHCVKFLPDMGKNFYAVRVGRNTGVFNSWSECEVQVKKYPGAVFKGFHDRSDADSFVSGSNSCGGKRGGNVYPMSSSGGGGKISGGGSYGGKDSGRGGGGGISSYISRARERYSGNFTSRKNRYCGSNGVRDLTSSAGSGSSESDCERRVVYSDGCCTNNGFKGASAGIGVYWGDGNSHNLSEKLLGHQTNQRAELVAACRAIESALDQGHSSIELKTDSVYTIKAATEWITKWKNNGWRTSNCEAVKNKEDIQRLDNLCGRLDIKWTHVRGHVGIPGNEAADSLAKAGSRK